MSVIFEGAIGWAVGRVGDAAMAPIHDHLKTRGARKELAAIAERAVEAAVATAPALAGDLRTETFLHHVAAPMLLTALARPADSLDGGALARSYVDRFVAPFLTGPSATETLRRVFHTHPDEIAAAFDAFLARVRADLLASTHWRAPMETRLHVETHDGVARLQRGLDQILERLGPPAPEALSGRGVDGARRDARIGSEGLNAWPQDIAGHLIARPELEELVARIRAHPGGRTLVVAEPGLGKSALLAQLSERLSAQGMTVFALKADQLDPEVRTLADVAVDLGMSGDIEADMALLARAGPLVVIIDQLDAVSAVMDHSGRRMRLLLRLAKFGEPRPGGSRPPVHVVVSSRPFEADHDARFRTLAAQTIILEPPAIEAVEALLATLGIPKPSDAGLRETIRRPFALKLYVDIHTRGAPVQNLLASELLTAWLEAAQLGQGRQRADTLDLMTELAGEMTQTESLWRPVDRFLAARPHAVRLGEAAGLLHVQDGKLGFSHQSWLDDFQARSLTNVEDLCAFVWRRQDGLFCRATVLRALQRLRQFDPEPYLQAIDGLLLAEQTRRHVRHLVVDHLAGQAAPLPRELAWVSQLLRTDPVLARRALARTLSHWRGWRDHLKPSLPILMGETAFRWSAVRFLQAELALDPDTAIDLIEAHWLTPSLAASAFEVLREAPIWTPRVEALVERIFDQQLPQDFRVSHFADKLAEAGRPEAAARLVRMYVARLDERLRERTGFHRFDNLATQAPLALARELWPWLLDYACTERIATHRYFTRYARIGARFRDIVHRNAEDGLLRALIKALNALAQQDPQALLELLGPAFEIEIDDVQALIAEVFAEAGCALAQTGLDYLLGDPRRLALGHAQVLCDDGVYRAVEGFASLQLVEAISPCLEPASLDRLVQAIETWEPYSLEARTEEDADTRRLRRQWADERRLALLERLPRDALPARRLRRVLEWRAVNPIPRVSVESPITLRVSQPTMSADQMAKAADRDILRMLNLIHDGMDPQSPRVWRRGGGVVELGRAFAEFGLAHPQRALAIAEQALTPGRHDTVGGELVAQLSRQGVEPGPVLSLIRRQAAAGFASPGWREDAARALDTLAEPLAGLEDVDLAMLETWLDDAPAPSPDDDDDDRLSLRGPRDRPQPILFGHVSGLEILRGGNLTILSAMAEGVCSRKSFAPDHLLAIFSRHLSRPETTATWVRLLGRYGAWLLDADAEALAAFFESLIAAHPSVFDARASRTFLWNCRGAFPSGVVEEVLGRWRDSDQPDLNQLAGEFLCGLALLDEATALTRPWIDVLWHAAGPTRVGALFAASGAWREEAETLGEPAQALLLPRCALAAGDEAHAIAYALGSRRAGRETARAHTLLRAAAANPAVLAACQGHALGGLLQDLLLQPGGEALVLEVAEAVVRMPGAEDLGCLFDEDLVHIAISLQRNDGPLRARAMTLYETLLDREAHEAEQAAFAALRH